MSNNSIEHFKKAIYQLHLTEHLLEVIYPLVKDPKMLLSVLSNLEQTHNSLFESVLPSNLITADTTFITKLNSFEDLLKPQIVVTNGMIKTIKTVHELANQHQESAVAFTRKNFFVICDANYTFKKIDSVSIGEQVHNTRKLTKEISRIIKKEYQQK